MGNSNYLDPPIPTPQDLARALIKFLESCRIVAYLDTANKPTIGWGTRIYPSGISVEIGDTCTQEQAQEYLELYLEKNVFPELSHYDLPPKIYAACASFLYNEGHLWMDLKNILSLKMWDKLPDCFMKYIISDGRVSPGLERRRKEEIDFFTS